MQVTVLERKNKAALVEWIDAVGPHRVIIPAEKADGGDVDSKTLDEGIIYGVPWEHIIILSVTPAQIARLLREKGIWTEQDLQKNVNLARSALSEAYGIDFKNLLEAVHNASEGN